MNPYSEGENLSHVIVKPSSEQQAKEGKARQKIYSVDDSADNLLLIEMILRMEEDYKVESFLSGQAVLDAIRKSPPSLLLLDFMMPGMTGLEVLEQLNRELFCHQFPVVVISAMDRSAAEIAFYAGASEFIQKPFAIDNFIETVRTQLS